MTRQAIVATAVAVCSLFTCSEAIAQGPGMTYASGFYVGGEAGGASNSGNAGPVFPDPGQLNGSGLIGGAFAGYNFVDGNLLVGPEIGVIFGSLSASGSATSTFFGETFLAKYTVSSGPILYANGRIGWTQDDWLVYGTGGLAAATVTNAENTTDVTAGGTPVPAFSYTGSAPVAGFDVGVGFEKKLTQNVSLGLEYRYINLGTVAITGNLGAGGSTSPLNTSLSSQVLAARLSFSIN